MRIKLTLTPSRAIVPYNHLPVLTGALHQWLGPNEEHDGLSLYTFSSLLGGMDEKGRGLRFRNGATWYISARDADFLMRSVQGILSQPDIRWGMCVERAELLPPPAFPDSGEVRFWVASPVFIKRKRPDDTERHFLFDEPESDALLTESLRYKLHSAGLPQEGATARFDRRYRGAQTKKLTYRKADGTWYDYRASVCPVFVKGSAEQLRFAWDVGVGQATGVGFGCLEVAADQTLMKL